MADWTTKNEARNVFEVCINEEERRSQYGGLSICEGYYHKLYWLISSYSWIVSGWTADFWSARISGWIVVALSVPSWRSWPPLDGVDETGWTAGAESLPASIGFGIFSASWVTLSTVEWPLLLGWNIYFCYRFPVRKYRLFSSSVEHVVPYLRAHVLSPLKLESCGAITESPCSQSKNWKVAATWPNKGNSTRISVDVKTNNIYINSEDPGFKFTQDPSFL